IGGGGPRRLRYGAARDLLLGETMVRADGAVASSGGRVVKNVAGYDLGKLLTGSLGTLGVVVSAIWRLHPLPAATAWVSATVSNTAALPELTRSLMDPAVDVTAVEFDAPRRDVRHVVAMVDGTPDGVTERAERAARAVGGEV